MSGHLSRLQFSITAGGTVVLDHNLAVRDPRQIMVVQCAPWDPWMTVSMSGQPTASSITFINSGGPTVVNVAIMVLPEFMAPTRTDDY